MEDCLFCDLANGRGERDLIWENEEFVAISNKYPRAPIHILVMPKAHLSKRELASGRDGGLWGKIMGAVFEVVRLKGMDKTGYKLVNNGAGYNHFDHEHIHVLGGTKGEPAGET